MAMSPQDEKVFRDEVQAFLAQELTADLRKAGYETTGTYSAIEACRLWHHRLYIKGWIAPAWPKEYGGTGWSPWQRMVFEQACAKANAPILFAGGLRSIGPLLIERGTPEQKKWYLPAILSGDDLWCQGFSEPNAGSDLAALHITARSDGDDFILNGSKLWTTGAHLANRMFCLVRTAKGERPQQGISFLLLDMDTPGLTVEPIAMLTGEHEFNQVRFDDVRVPKKNLVGAENEGWAVAKSLMRHARASNTTSSHLHRAFAALKRLYAEMQMQPEPGLMARFHALQIELDAFDGLELRTRHAACGPHNEAEEKATASLLKVLATELHQKITQVGMALAGPYAMVEHLEGSNQALMAKEGGLATAKYLGLRAATIYSGTSEIHRNLLMSYLEKGGSLLPPLSEGR